MTEEREHKGVGGSTSERVACTPATLDDLPVGMANSRLLRARNTDRASMSPTRTRTRIVAEARAFIGTPYRHQASLRGVGCDCLGLVRGVWRALHGGEPEATPAYTRDWAEASGIESLAEAARRHLVELD